jgi:hypothetical protein
LKGYSKRVINTVDAHSANIEGSEQIIK